LRWVLVGKPRSIAESKDLRDSLEVLLPKARLDLFAQGSGVDLRTVPEGLIAGFDYSTLYLAKLATQSGVNASKQFEERLVSGAVQRKPHPRIYVMSGVVGRTPETLVSVDDRMIAVAVGDPTPARVVEAFARGRLKNSKPALKGSALSTLPELMSEHLAVFYAPGPFADDWQHAAGGVLNSALALAIAVRPSGPGKLRATLLISGDWGTSGQDAGARLIEAWNRLAQSSTGKLFGLDDESARANDVTPLRPELRVAPELLTLTVEFDLAPVVRGLRAAVVADVWEILELPKRPDGVKNGQPQP
jgi:hypothetical protein